jgi:hypothetical protein
MPASLAGRGRALISRRSLDPEGPAWEVVSSAMVRFRTLDEVRSDDR